MTQQTTYQKFDKAKDREQLIEDFINNRLEEIGAAFGNDYIRGLRLEWVSATSVRVNTGAADIPDGSRRLRVTTAITVPATGLTANTWYHLYLYNNAGAPAVELVAHTAGPPSTVPTSYFGDAYQKGVDATRRYLGSIRTDASGNVLNFQHDALLNLVLYRAPTGAAPFRVLVNQTSTSEAGVACGALIPATSFMGYVRLIVDSTNTAIAQTGLTGDSITPGPTSSGIHPINSLAYTNPVIQPLDASQSFTYWFQTAPSGGGLYVDVIGYYFRR